MKKSRPTMFSESKKTKGKISPDRLSSLQNLGPVLEKTLNKVGIQTVDQFVKLGWEGTILKLAKIHPRYLHTIYAEVLIGALQNVVWHKISEKDKKAAKDFIRSLRKK